MKRVGLDLVAEWKHVNEDTQDRKQIVSAERTYEIFKHISGKQHLRKSLVGITLLQPIHTFMFFTFRFLTTELKCDVVNLTVV